MNEATTPKELTVTRQSAVAPWADRQDVRELAERLQAMMPGAQSLTKPEALALAQAAVAHGLDPFNGELWYLKDRQGKPLGLMAGIKGHRRAAHRQMREEGGGNYWPEFEGPLSVDDKSALNIPKGALAFRCKLRDTSTINEYVSTIERLIDKLPWEIVQEIVGSRPYTVGIGFATPGEPSKMTTAQLAMKRAEADALKRRFDLPFGEAVGVGNDDGGTFVTEDENGQLSPPTINRILTEDAQDGEWETVEPPPAETEEPPPAVAKRKAAWTTEQINAIVENRLAQNTYNAAGMLNLSHVLTPADAIDVVIEWATVYRKARNDGDDSPNAAATADETLRAELPTPEVIE